MQPSEPTAAMRRLWRWIVWNVRYRRKRLDIYDYLYEQMMAELDAEEFEGGYPWPNL